ncbi:MAG: YcxB family protein [Acidobacteriota bacterium]
MNQPVSLSIKYTVEDIIRVALFTRNQNFVYRYDAILVGLVIFLASAAVVLFMASDLREIRIPSLIVVGAIPAILVGGSVYLLHGFFHPWRIRQRLEKYFDLYPIFADTLEIEISDEGIRSTGKLSSSFVSWPAFVKIVESKTDLIFYTTSAPNILLPKSAFATDQEFLSIWDFAAEIVGLKSCQTASES